MRSRRREFLILLNEHPMGRVRMTLDRPDPEEGEPTIRLLTPPKKLPNANGWFLFWNELTDEGAQMMMWTPTTPREIEEATAFYEVAGRKPKSDGATGQRSGKLPDWLRALRNPKPEQRTDEEQRLIEAILEDPDNDEVRFRYADWLTGQGSPQGEFIRLDTLRERMPEDDPQREPLDARWLDIISDHGKDFVAPLKKFGLSPLDEGTIIPALALNRGVITHVDVTRDGVLPQKMDALFDAVPFIDELSLSYAKVPLAGIVNHPRMARIRRLSVSPDCQLWEADLAALLASRHLDRLRELDLGFTITGAVVGRRLAEAPLLSQLTLLDLGFCEIGAEGIAALAAADRFDSLIDLNLEGDRFDSDSAADLFRCQSLRKLERLSLSYNEGIDAAFSQMSKGPLSSSLLSLEIESCNLGESAPALAKARFRKLESLNLRSNELDEDAIEALWSAKWFARLKELDLGSNPLSPAAVDMLACVEFERLEILALDECALGDAAFARLVRSPVAAGLKFLNVDACRLTAAAMDDLASTLLPKLKQISLERNRLGVNGAMILAGIESCELEQLWVTRKGIGRAGRKALWDRYGHGLELV